jgi:hypothetical protein
MNHGCDNATGGENQQFHPSGLHTRQARHVVVLGTMTRLAPSWLVEGFKYHEGSKSRARAAVFVDTILTVHSH